MNTFRITPPDGGMVYTETDFTNFIVEPFNTVSAFIFLLIALYWFNKLKGSYSQYSFLSASVVILSIGAIGGTIYHAFRISPFFIMMDWLPILILCLMASFYFLLHAMGKWWKAITVFMVLFLVQALLSFWFREVGQQVAVNANYFIMGLFVLFSVIYFSRKQQFRNFSYVAIALVSFIIALLFRIYDQYAWVSVGTHFLWHCFGAVACHLMFLYLYKTSSTLGQLETVKA